MYVASVVFGCFKSRSGIASSPHLGVSSSSSAALHPSQTAEGTQREPRDGGVVASVCSPLLCYAGKAEIPLR
jgi:hypothetical protein